MSASPLIAQYKTLLDPAEALDARIRCLYTLKEADRNVNGAMLLLEAVDTTDSVLLQHELLYNVGQFGFPETLPRLMDIVTRRSSSSNHGANNATNNNNPNADYDQAAVSNADSCNTAMMAYDVVSRHEAIEALGAIGSNLPSVLSLLEHYALAANEAEAPIRESCALALERLRFVATAEGAAAAAPPAGCHFVSVDPAPAFSEGTPCASVPTLQSQLLDASTCLWDRYRVMFQLRNLASEAAVLALSAALRVDTSSCLFRHEIAFVLGQLEHPASAPALTACVEDQTEHPMVRHEAAEALGALAEQDSLAVLEAHCADPQAIVRDSCIVALEMHKYWSQFKPKA